MFYRFLNRTARAVQPEAVVPSQTRVSAYDEARPWATVYDPAASSADIYYCFRLILGRSPQDLEWKGHSSRSGEPLSEVVKTYLNSAEFKARGLQIAEMPPGVIEKHNGRFHVFADSEDQAIGQLAFKNAYEPNVTRVIKQLLLPGDHFLDVGANIGYFSLLGATLVGPEGRVYAVEPNELNVKLLESSRRRNAFDNLTIMQVGASKEIETLFIHSMIGNGSTSTISDAEAIFGSRTAAGIPLDVLLSARQKAIKLIKIDVEGFEYQALQGALGILTKDHPYIVFEFSANGIVGATGEGFLLWLQKFGYSFVNISGDRLIDDVQTVEEVVADFRAAMVDHLDVLAKPVS